MTKVPAPGVLSSPIFRVIIDVLRSHGHDVTALKERFRGVEEALQFEDIAPFASACVSLAGDELFMAKIGLSLQVGTYGPVEYLWRSASTFESAFQASKQFERLVSSQFRPYLCFVRPDQARLIYPLLPGAGLGRYGNELTVAAGVAQLRAMSGGTFVIDGVGFAHPPPANAAELSACLGVSATYSQTENWIQFAAEELARPVVTADRGLFAVLLGLLGRLAEQLERPRDFVEQVEQAIAQMLPNALDIGRVARAIHVSPRTLQRRLQEAGTTMREVVERVRRRQARAFVQDGSIPLREVARRLGFSDFTAFARAYRRWEGETPGATRARFTSES